jgi:acyl-CoA thioester hydrolase
MIDNGFHTTEVRVRYADTDQMGVAYNGNYLVWFEIGRTEFLREKGLAYKNLEDMGFMLPVIESFVKYLKPIHYDEVIIIKTSFGEKPSIRLKMSYEIIVDGKLMATGYTLHVFTDRDMKPVRPPGNVLKLMNELWQS